MSTSNVDSQDEREPPAGGDAGALRASIHALRIAALAGTASDLLRGRKLGLLCAADDAPQAVLFRRAAEALGASVAHIRHGLSGSSTPQEVLHTARLLGRLYDALECQGMTLALVRQLRAEAGVPVYDGLAAMAEAPADLGPWLDGEIATEAAKCLAVQAVLLNTVA